MGILAQLVCRSKEADRSKKAGQSEPVIRKNETTHTGLNLVQTSMDGLCGLGSQLLAERYCHV